MKSRKWLLLSAVLVISISVISINAQSKLSEKDKKSIEGIEETYRTAWLKNDSKTILGLFAQDATIYPNGLSPRKGIKAISDFWFAPASSITVIDEYEIEIEEITGTNVLAFSTGATKIKWTTTAADGTDSKRYKSAGNYLTVFSKRNGSWKIIKHIWNGKFDEVK